MANPPLHITNNLTLAYQQRPPFTNSQEDKLIPVGTQIVASMLKTNADSWKPRNWQMECYNDRALCCANIVHCKNLCNSILP